MRSRCVHLIAAIAILGMMSAPHSSKVMAQSPFDGLVVWRPLAIGAGGFIQGIDIARDGTKVVRTDVFGAYIWNRTSNRWIQLVTAKSGRVALAGASGVWEIRIAPSLTTRLFMIYNNEVYRSDNRGASWLKTSFDQISGADANGSAKSANQKMAIDPVNPDIVYVGTPTKGAWRSIDGGSTWQRVPGVVPGSGPGNAGIVFDPKSGTMNGRTKTIYIPSYGQGVWRSADAGATWTQIAGGAFNGPTKVWTAQIGADGVYWCSDHTDVWKYQAGAWTRILPDGRHYGAIAVATDPTKSGRVILSGPNGGKGGFETLDNGATWLGGWQWNWPRPGQGQIATDIPWLAHADTAFMSVGDMKIDPSDGTVYFAEGIGVWKTDWPQKYVPFNWTSQSLGIEELVANDIIAPPEGKPIVASWDRPFFRSDDPAKFPKQYGPINGVFSGGWSLDYASSNPSFIAGIANWGSTDISGFSEDGGRSWHQFRSKPAWKQGGCIAVATPSNIVWVSGNNGIPYFTKDGGSTWKVAPNLPTDGWIFAYYLKRRIVVADRVNIGTFYLYNSKHGLYRSTDGGDHWSLVYGGEIAPWSGFSARLRATPGHAGHLWFTSGPQSGQHPAPFGFFKRSTDGGRTWHNLPHVLEVVDFGFGKPKRAGEYPAIYIVGWVNNRFGVWRSDDQAVSWINIGDRPDDNIDSIVAVNGDMNVYGRVYVGFHGSGFAYGDIK